jgi:2-polyprenyl-6-methoxyphenol hydroxylase-like FAD-dependent oxidoreductase
MGHRDEVSEARREPETYWRGKLGEHPGLAVRIDGAPPGSKLRSTADTPAFFRVSSGPGWALAGDAGHFKDPVTGQGMRDAMFAGRTLAEQVLPVLDDPAAVDRETRRWEAARDRECLPAYHFANADTRVERPSPALCELVRDAGRTLDADLSDLFGRARTPQQIAPLSRLARVFAMALARGERPRSETLVRGASELRTELEIRLERRADRFRSIREIHGSEHPGAAWPSPPQEAAPPGGLPLPRGATTDGAEYARTTAPAEVST